MSILFKVINLIILLIAICLIYFVVNKSVNNRDNFDQIQESVGPNCPVYQPNNNPYYKGTGLGPYTLNFQMYPRIPWYPKVSKNCEPGQCGATATCTNGICQMNKTDKTAFNVNIR